MSGEPVLVLSSEPKQTAAAAGLKYGHGAGSTRVPLLAFAIAVVVALAMRAVMLPRLVQGGLYDDGYITLRYAANIAEGHGFVYNVGEPVWGTTTPLFTLILSGTARVFGSAALEMSALIIGLVCSFLFWLLLAVILEKQKVPRSISAVVLLVVLFSPAYFENSLSGMETPLVLALLVASLWAYIQKRPIALGVLAALLLLARIDTAIWLAVLGFSFLGSQWRVKRTAILKALVAFLVVALPWHVYAYMTFHSLIPQSVVGKAVSHAAFSRLDWSDFVRLYNVYLPILRLGTWAWIGIATTFLLMLVGLRTLWKEFPGLCPLGVYFFLFVAVFFASKSPLYMWYFPPTQWIAVLLILCGVRAIWDRGLLHGASAPVRIAPYAAYGTWVVALAAWSDFSLPQSRSALRPWADLGDFIRDQTREGDKVFLEHIGIVGYRSHRPIIDNMGLVSPEIISLKRQYPENYEWLRRALVQFQPKVVVLYPAEDPIRGKGNWQPKERDWFENEYNVVRTVEDAHGTATAYVYQRKHADADAH
jgi:hypothetical protein